MSLNPILAPDRPGLVGGRVQGHKRSLPWELRTVPLASLKSFRLCQGCEVLLFVVRNQVTFHCGIKTNKVKLYKNFTAAVLAQEMLIIFASLPNRRILISDEIFVTFM